MAEIAALICDASQPYKNGLRRINFFRNFPKSFRTTFLRITYEELVNLKHIFNCRNTVFPPELIAKCFEWNYYIPIMLYGLLWSRYFPHGIILFSSKTSQNCCEQILLNCFKLFYQRFVIPVPTRDESLRGQSQRHKH